MPQLHIDKDRSYRLGKGNALDATNKRLTKTFDSLGLSYETQFHPTKGKRFVSRRRFEAGEKLEAAFHFWPRIAAKLTGSSVGGSPCERPAHPKLMPHQGKRECARRRGDLRRARLGIS